ncbi:MAG TPA: chemotaxis protein CheW, partial [Pseudomonadales bacterium]|nr:chemotaxis protein CheW [Pseudomonadales bacterium]
VKQNIKSLNGTLDMQSEQGKGTTFTIRLPLTLAIVDGQLIRVNDSIYVVPLVSISESLQIIPGNINRLAGSVDVYRLRNENIPVVNLSDLFGFNTTASSNALSMMVVVESNDKKIGLVVDELLDQQQVVIKSLETNYQSVKGVSGATILGDGTVAMICDIHDIFAMSACKPELSSGRNDNTSDKFLAA